MIKYHKGKKPTVLFIFILIILVTLFILIIFIPITLVILIILITLITLVILIILVLVILVLVVAAGFRWVDIRPPLSVTGCRDWLRGRQLAVGFRLRTFRGSNTNATPLKYALRSSDGRILVIDKRKKNSTYFS
jgi:hypothetical protein